MCFSHFDFEMCFAPRPHNLKMCSATVTCNHFWFRNEFRDTMRCSVWTSHGQKCSNVLCVAHFDFETRFAPHLGPRFFHISTSKVLTILTSKCASLHTLRFSDLTSGPSWTMKHWKKLFFRMFFAFERACFLFLLTQFLLSFPFCCFFLFSDSSHLCLCTFPHCHKFDLRISFDKKNPLNLSSTLIENCYHHCS